MKLILILGSVIGPIAMTLLQSKWSVFRSIFRIGAIISALIFGNIASLSIFQIIKNNTVFMTNIHGLFLNPFFLITGAYLGLYFIYLLILSARETFHK